MKRVIFGTSFLLVGSLALAQQDIRVKLERVEIRTKEFKGMEAEMPTNLLKTPVGYRGIPQNLREHAIKFLTFQPNQWYFERYLAGEFSKAELLERLKRYGGDTLRLSRTPTRHGVALLVGTLPTGKRMVIVDGNNNRDFADDTPVEFDFPLTDKQQIKAAMASVPPQEVTYEFFDGEKTLLRKTAFRPKVYNQDYQFADSLAMKWFVSALSVYNRVGRFRANTAEYRLAINTTISDIDPTGFSPSFTLLDENGGFGRIYYRPGDTLSFGQHVYVFDQFSPGAEWLHFKYLYRDPHPPGIEENNTAPNIAENTLDVQQINLKSLRGNYVLLDYWGTWCMPCVAMIPTLKEIAGRFANKKFRMISFAYDREAGKVRDMIKAKEMNWSHVFVPQLDTLANSPVNRYKVTCFPTTVLIDPQGIIVVRGCGEEALQRAVRVLEQNLQ